MKTSTYSMTLADIPTGTSAIVKEIGGEREFRRRLMELGILPGVCIKVIRIIPTNDIIELLVRECHWVIRRKEAAQIIIL